MKAVKSPRALNRILSRFVNVLMWQVEQFIKRAFVLLEVTATVGIEDSGHQLGPTNVLALLYLFDTEEEPLPSWLFGDSPVAFFRTSYAKRGL